jgi:hypothetical protein
MAESIEPEVINEIEVGSPKDQLPAVAKLELN